MAPTPKRRWFQEDIKEKNMEKKEEKLVLPMKGPRELGVWKWKTLQESYVSSWEINTEDKAETKATPILRMNK